MKQGYLYKKSHGLNKEWKKKYVTLLDDGRLTYHPSLHVSLEWSEYCKTPKFSDTQKIAVIILKFEQCSSTIE